LIRTAPSWSTIATCERDLPAIRTPAKNQHSSVDHLRLGAARLAPSRRHTRLPRTGHTVSGHIAERKSSNPAIPDLMA
jgi:hypothetical protein